MTPSPTIAELETAWREALNEWSAHWEEEEAATCPTPYCPTYAQLSIAERDVWMRWQRARALEVGK